MTDASRAQEIAEALDAAWLELGEEPTLEAVAPLVEVRAPLVEALVAIRPEALPSAARARLRAALERALARDGALIDALRQNLESTGRALKDLGEARSAARGYRGGEVRGGVVIRTA
ncbi:MAG: flagellar protein FliT [Myxococcales bacterium]|nr:flagellar protein FliT [Myxococcales bacterium]